MSEHRIDPVPGPTGSRLACVLGEPADALSALHFQRRARTRIR